MSATGIGEGPKPKHQQLRQLLVAMAVPGRAIPSERELMRTYHVSRTTVRRAIDGLVADNLLERVHGVGTFATRPRLDSQLHLASFSQDMRRRGRTPSTRLLLVALEVPPAEAAAALHLTEHQPAWHLVRVRLADNAPIAHEDGWYSADLLPNLDHHDLASGSLYQIMSSDYGHPVDHAEQTLWGEVADARFARLLEAPRGTPLLVFRRISTTAGLPIEYVISRYRGDRYQVHMQLSSDDASLATQDWKGRQ